MRKMTAFWSLFSCLSPLAGRDTRSHNAAASYGAICSDAPTCSKKGSTAFFMSFCVPWPEAAGIKRRSSVARIDKPPVFCGLLPTSPSPPLTAK
ncbi:uncharacterized protein F5147DRAFT_727673 [Suillus discolor]|uniref:Secreted protein n=1 Tax=Suillus discolor TaxID=1912936 RepID=A0A9P7JLX6_9AGAM|nr:uncharacterized protein F5147DRAFT_727673 [Suillus discolor]KAG2087706.1 hypothetical protein F5147DRAFT_727673 [Suillus discolor]